MREDIESEAKEGEERKRKAGATRMKKPIGSGNEKRQK